MPGNYTHPTRAIGTLLTAAIYNSDHQDHINNQTPAGTGSHMNSVAEMKVQTNPGGLGTEVLTASMAVELEMLRFILARLGNSTYWYQAGIANNFTNNTGVLLNPGDVVAVNPAADSSVILDDVVGTLQPLLISLGTVANLAQGTFANLGVLSITNAGAVTRGHYLRKSATTKALEDMGIAVGDVQIPPSGSVAVAIQSIGGSGSVLAIMFPAPAATLVTTKGDILTYSTAPARQPAGADGTVLAYDSTQTTGLFAVAGIPVALTNKTGGGLVLGDVVAIDTASDSGVVLADVLGTQRVLVVCLETIANNSAGLFLKDGVVSCLANGAVTRGNYVRKSATTKAVEDTGVAEATAAAPPPGTIGIALAATGGGFVKTLLRPGLQAPVGLSGTLNLIAKNDAGTPNTKFGITADVATFRNPVTGALAVATAINVTNDTALDNTNANGRDQGAPFGANNFIHFYLVLDGSTVKSRSSLTPPPNGPAAPPAGGENSWVYAGAVYYNVTPLLVKTRIFGPQAFYEVKQGTAATAANGVETAVSVSTLVPANAQTMKMSVSYDNTAALNSATIRYLAGSDFTSLQADGAISHEYNDKDFDMPNVSQNFYYQKGAGTLVCWIQGYRVSNGAV